MVTGILPPGKFPPGRFQPGCFPPNEAWLCEIYGWAETNNLSLNASKFLQLRYEPNQKPTAAYLTPDGSLIKHCSKVKDLVVHNK